MKTEQRTEVDRLADAKRRAAQITRERARANRALPALLESYPPATQIAARAFTWYSKAKPKAADLAESRAELARDIERHEALRHHGGNAMSDYDLTSSSGGVDGLELALSLTSAHVSWGRGKIAYIENIIGDQAALFE